MRKLFATIIGLMALIPASAQVVNDKESIEQTLKEAYETDQGLRKDLFKSTTKEEQEEAWIKINKQDSINQSIVLPIIARVMSGEIEDLSAEAYNACFYILQHADIKAQLKYADFVKDGFRAGDISASNYIMFDDRVNIRMNKAQVYGTQSVSINGSKLIPYPIKNQAYRDSVATANGINLEGLALVEGSVLYNPEGITNNDIEDVKQQMLDAYGELKGQYNVIEVSDDEFVIMGILIASSMLSTNSPTETSGSLAKAEIKIDGITVTTSDENGYFAHKVSRDNIPEELTIEYGGAKITRKLNDVKPDEDFTFIYQPVK